MNIVADENITKVADYFSSFGKLTKLPGREITADSIQYADALFVRSITKVDRALLAASPVKFVASATSGIDHIDLDYLKQRDIEFAYAPGCNANSVVEYVLTALAELSLKKGLSWQKLSFGIVGAGNIGGLLATRLTKLNIPFTIYDPYLGDDFEFADALVSFDKVIEQSIITIHAPLTTTGKFPTYHLFDQNIIAKLRSDQVLINAARGGIVDNIALLERMRSEQNLDVVLDAWEHEPAINLSLLKEVDISTPHIAGYSFDGKLKGTEAIHQQFCDFIMLKHDCIPSSNIELNASNEMLNCSLLDEYLVTAYDINRDHELMQSLLTSTVPEVLFDQMRKGYPCRREFSNYSLAADSVDQSSDVIAAKLSSLGFTL